MGCAARDDLFRYEGFGGDTTLFIGLGAELELVPAMNADDLRKERKPRWTRCEHRMGTRLTPSDRGTRPLSQFVFATIQSPSRRMAERYFAPTKCRMRAASLGSTHRCRILAALRIQPRRCASQAILDRAPACSATQVDSD